jgi:hypothetical protein
MYRTHRTLTVALAALVTLALAGCATTRVNGFLERGMDFTQYRSYTWAQADQFSTGDPRLDNNDLFQKRLRTGVDRELQARGYEQAPRASAGLIVHFHASVHQQIDVNDLDLRYGFCDDCHSSVYDAGTLTIDLVDARTNKLVWRGWSEGVLDGIDEQSVLETRVDEAVTKILRQLPPML